MDDAEATEGAAARAEAIAALGSLPDFLANLKSQYVTPVVTGLRSSAEALETRTATRLANEALGAIRTAAEDANVTESEIVQLWDDAYPFLVVWYTELLEDANAIENEGDKAEAIEALGTLPQFVANLKSQYVTPVINGIRSSKEALETQTATREANEALQAIRTAAADVNITESEILQLWTDAQPFLETWYQELLDDANAIENEGDKAEAIEALGSLPAFIANLKSQYVTPIITSIQSSAEELETRVATREANEALQAIGTASEDVNVTEAGIIQLWEDAHPFLESWYNELLDDANAIEKESDRIEALASLGSLPEFIANLKSQHVTPVITSIRSSTEALETRTASRVANEALGAIREAAADVNVTESEIEQLWTEAQPFLEVWYNELLDDAKAIENEAEKTEALDALGTLPQFIANLKSQYVTPVINGIRSTSETLQTRTANRLANDAIQAIGEAVDGVNTTEAEILQLWREARPLIRDWYQELRQDIENDVNLSDAQRAEDLAELGTFSDFVANIREETVAPFLNRLRTSGFQSRSNLAQNVIDRSRFLLSTATSNEEFESERTGLVRATNDYYDIELARINELEASERDLQDLREDNLLNRVRALRDIADLEFQGADSQLETLRLGAARSREDVGLGLRRRLEDTLIDESGFGGLGIGQAVGLESQLTAAIEGAGAGDFISNLDQNVADVLQDFGSTFLGGLSFSDEDIAEFERFALDQARGATRH